LTFIEAMPRQLGRRAPERRLLEVAEQVSGSPRERSVRAGRI
jgi:hypothetical protein